MSDFDGMDKDELLVQVLALMADKLTKPSDMEWLSQQSVRLKRAMAKEDAVSNTVIEEYLKRVNLLDAGMIQDHPQLDAAGVDAIKAREARNQALMDEISSAYRTAYNQPAALPPTNTSRTWKTVPALPQAVLPPLLGKGDR